MSRMEHTYRSLGLGAAALSLIVTTTAAGAGQPPVADPHFTLAADGLPNEGRWKSNPVVVDINGDGMLDLAAHPRVGSGAQVWLANGRGSWRPASQGLTMDHSSCGGGLDLGDINRDGKLDLAVADHCLGVFVYFGDGHGNWQLRTSALNPNVASEIAEGDINPFTGAEHLALGDINEDGNLDLIASASDRGGFSVYLGDGQGETWREQQGDGLPSADDPEIKDVQKGGWATNFLLRDVNGDGHLDVAASYYAGPRVWVGDGAGKWERKSQGLPAENIGGMYWGIDVGDIDEDGRPDLLATHLTEGPQAFLQQADGSWKQAPEVMPDFLGRAWSAALDDLDNDGHLDMVIGGNRDDEPSNTYRVFVLRGDGQGGWTEVEETGLPASGLGTPWGIALADFDGNGRRDLVMTTSPPDTQRAAKRSEKSSGQEDAGQSAEAVEEQAASPALPMVQVWLNKSRTAGEPGEAKPEIASAAPSH